MDSSESRTTPSSTGLLPRGYAASLVAATLVGIAIGYLAATKGGAGDLAPSPKPKRQAIALPGVIPSEPAECACSEELASILRHLVDCEALLLHNEEQVIGTPVAVQRAVDTEAIEEEVGTVLAEALRSCGSVGKSVEWVDCTEYPCIALLSVEDATPFAGLAGCETLGSLTLTAAAHQLRHGTDGEKVETTCLRVEAMAPEGEIDEGNVSARFKARCDLDP